MSKDFSDEILESFYGATKESPGADLTAYENLKELVKFTIKSAEKQAREEQKIKDLEKDLATLREAAGELRDAFKEYYAECFGDEAISALRAFDKAMEGK